MDLEKSKSHRSDSRAPLDLNKSSCSSRRPSSRIGMDLRRSSFDRGFTHTIKTCSSKQFQNTSKLKTCRIFQKKPSLKNHSSGRNIGAPLVKRGRLAMAPMPPWISLNGPMTKVSELRMVLLVSHQHPNTRPEHPKKPKKCRIFFGKNDQVSKGFGFTEKKETKIQKPLTNENHGCI